MDDADPPAYGESGTSSAALQLPSIPLNVPPPPIRRSVADTKSLIMSNLSILRTAKQDEVDILTMSLPRESYPTQGVSSILFPHPRAIGLEQEQLFYYALIASRRTLPEPVRILLRSAPSRTIEDALESLLQMTQDWVRHIVMRHGNWDDRVHACCFNCHKAYLANRNT